MEAGEKWKWKVERDAAETGHCRAGQVSWVDGLRWPNDVGRPLAVLCELYMTQVTVVRAGGDKEPRDGDGSS
jgi:hypothetical protein